METRTPRLLLRDFSPADAATAFSYHCDPRYLRYYRPGKWSSEDDRALIERFIGWARESPRLNYQLAIALDEHIIGCVGVRWAEQAPGTAEFGIELDPDFWGRGYALEAGTALVDFAYGELGLEQIVAHCISANAAIRRLLEKLGLELAEHLEPEPWMRERGWTMCLYRGTRQRQTN